ncbi:hypothetical protein Tco_1410955 [Tanacetum coccineum]
MDKCKTGLGYNAIPPPYTGNFMPQKSDLVYSSLDDFVDVNESVVEKPTVETNEPETSRKENGAPIIEDWVSDSDEENVPKIKIVERSNKPSFAKINFVKYTEQVKTPRKTSFDKNKQNTPSPRGNKRNWNQQMYNNGRFTKLVWTNVQWVNKQNFSKLTHHSPKRNMVPRTVLTRSGPISLNTARPVNIVQSKTAVDNAGPMKNGTRVNTARPKAVISAVKGNKENVGNPRQDLKDKGVIDSGCSRRMTGNRSYLTDYKEIDGGFFCLWSTWQRLHSTTNWPADPLFSQDSKSSPDARFKSSREEEKKDAKDPGNESGNPTEGRLVAQGYTQEEGIDYD